MIACENIVVEKNSQFDVENEDENKRNWKPRLRLILVL